jgi:hypothetical protein
VYSPTVLVTLQIKINDVFEPVTEYVNGAFQNVVFSRAGYIARAIEEFGIYRLSKASADDNIQAVRYYV